MEHETEQHETEDQVSAAAIDAALAPHAGAVIDVRPTPPPRLALRPEPPPRLAPRPAPPLPELTAPAAPGFVYVLGSVEPRFPSLGVEKEFAQATGRAATNGLTDRAALKAVLSDRQNRYLVRELCWVLTVEGLETYLLRPRDPADFDLLLETLRARPQATDLDVVIGTRGPLAPPDACNGLMVPLLGFKQIYSFDIDGFVKAIPRPERVPEAEFTPVAEEVLGAIMQMADMPAPPTSTAPSTIWRHATRRSMPRRQRRTAAAAR